MELCLICGAVAGLPLCSECCRTEAVARIRANGELVDHLRTLAGDEAAEHRQRLDAENLGLRAAVDRIEGLPDGRP